MLNIFKWKIKWKGKKYNKRERRAVENSEYAEMYKNETNEVLKKREKRKNK